MMNSMHHYSVGQCFAPTTMVRLHASYIVCFLPTATQYTSEFRNRKQQQINNGRRISCVWRTRLLFDAHTAHMHIHSVSIYTTHTDTHAN